MQPQHRETTEVRMQGCSDVSSYVCMSCQSCHVIMSVLSWSEEEEKRNAHRGQNAWLFKKIVMCIVGQSCQVSQVMVCSHVMYVIAVSSCQ